MCVWGGGLSGECLRLDIIVRLRAAEMSNLRMSVMQHRLLRGEIKTIGTNPWRLTHPTEIG